MTSRLIVKNLPNGIKEDRLHSLFGKYGQVTDCSLKFTKDGKFRKFAFIGYRDQQDAETAVKQLNKTFIDTARIQVEYAKDFSDVNKPRAWSKYAKDSTAFQKTLKIKTDEDKSSKKQKNEKKKEAKEKALDDMLGELKDDPEFEEFMEAHQRKGNKPIWDNDVLRNQEIKDKGFDKMIDSDDSSSGVESEDENMDDDDDDDSKDDDDNEFGKDDEDDNDKSSKVNKKMAVKKNLSDKEYLMSKVSDNVLLSESSNDDDDDDDDSSSGDDVNDEKAVLDQKSSKTKKKAKAEIGKDINDKGDNSNKSEENDDKKSDRKFVIKMKGLQGSSLEKAIKEFFNPLEPSDIRIPRNAKKKPIGIAYVDFSTDKDLDQATRRNKNFINGKRIFLKKCQEDEIDVSIATTPKPWELKEKEDDGDQETIAESGRLFVRNLAYTATDEELEALFGKYGPLTECNLPVDSQTKKIKGFAHVTYMMPEHAVKAYSELDGTIFMGRMLHILPGKSRADDDMETTEGSSYKNQKKAKQKSLAASTHNWNTLFLGANAVADVMAEKYGTSKSQILDAESKQSLGVRMALGETQLVSETRDFLLENGVSLDSFSQPSAARSKSVILVKNLPAGTKVDELRNVFSKHGSVGRVVMPPSGITAIMEYLEPAEAKKGFKLLAYSKFQHVPLYLEWAPIDVFMKKSEQTETEGEKMEEDTEEKEVESNDVVEESEDGCTLFVKNINFDSSDEDFKKVFERCGKVKSATVAKKKDIKNPGKFLSMGYGFVEFKHKRGADKAMRELQHTVLDDHTLELKISNRSTLQPKSSKKKEKAKLQDISTKILVRNIPFEAHKKEIFELFKVFGELKSVRLPKKLSGTGSHRGFGFVDFLTKQDAKRAFEALCHSTHLFGRRLVLEWAQTTEDLDELRKKTAKHYHEDVPKKKLKKSSIMEELDTTE